MSFGFSIGDFVLLTQLALRVVNGAREACGVHDEFTREVSGLQIVLNALEREVSKPQSILNSKDDDRKKELAALVQPCRDVLKLMGKRLDKYNALADEKKRTTNLWKKISFGGKIQDLVKVRQDLATHAVTITMFINLHSIGSLGNVEVHMKGQKGDMKGLQESVNWIIGSLQAKGGHGEGSILTSYASDDKLFWKDLRRGLVEEGYSSRKLEKHKVKIHEYVKKLGEQGAFDELPVVDEDTSEISELGSAMVSNEQAEDISHDTPVMDSLLPLENLPNNESADESSLLQSGESLPNVLLDDSETIHYPLEPFPSSPGVEHEGPLKVKQESKGAVKPHKLFYHMKWCRTVAGKDKRYRCHSTRQLNTQMHGKGDLSSKICPELLEESLNKFTLAVPHSNSITRCDALPSAPCDRNPDDNPARLHHWPHFRVAHYVRECERGVIPWVASFSRACSVTTAYHYIPPDHNTKRWDPELRFLVVQANVFDHFYFGKFVYDWIANIEGVESPNAVSWTQIWKTLGQLSSCVYFWDSHITEARMRNTISRLHKWFHDALSLLEEFNQVVKWCEEATVEARDNTIWEVEDVKWFVIHLASAHPSDVLLMSNWYTRAKAWSRSFKSNWKDVCPRGKDSRSG